jgi:hypothetical protein
MRMRLKTMKMKIKRRTMIKGEMIMIKIRKMIKRYRVQETKTATPNSPPSDSKRSPRELHPRRYT